LSKARSPREPSGSSVRIDLSLRVWMSSRVLVPMAARHIGSAQPPRPRPFRVGPRGLVIGLASRINVSPSSHALVVRVRNLSAAILSPSSLWPSLRSTSLSREHTFIQLFRRNHQSLNDSDSLIPRPLRRTVLPAPLARPRQEHFACWVPTTPTNPRSRGRLIQPCGCMPTGWGFHAQLVSCRGSANHISGRIVHGLPPFRGFSPPSPPDPLGSDCPPCRFPPCGAAAPRIRAFGDIHTLRRGLPPSVRVRSPTATLFTSPKGRSSPGCFPPPRMTFRPRPALLPDSSLGLSHA